MLNGQIISKDVQRLFGMTADPFDDDNINSNKDVFLGGQYPQVLESLVTAAQRRGRCTALIAPRGSGKTILMDALYTQLIDFNRENTANKIRLISPETKEIDKIKGGTLYETLYLNLAGDANARVPRNIERRAVKTKKLLTSALEDNFHICLLLDDAHKLNAWTLHAIKNFLEIRVGFKRLISVILIGQRELHQMIDERPVLKDLKIRTSYLFLHPHQTDYDVYQDAPEGESIPVDFARDYISHKFRLVSVNADGIIQPEAWEILVDGTYTVKELENRIAACLEYAFTNARDSVDRGVAKKVCGFDQKRELEIMKGNQHA